LRASLAARFLVLSVILLSLTLAQSPNGTITGIVQDPSGRTIPDAEIIVVNDLTNVQYQGKTNNEGIYVVTNLPPGPYRIQVSKPGFKTLIKPDLILNVQDAVAVSFTLPLGSVAEVVTIEAGAQMVDTQNAAVSTVIDRNFVASLPLNGRSFNTLLQLTPGVVIAQNVSGTSGQFSIGGQRTDANNFSVDGVSANFGVSYGQNVGESGTGGAQAFSVLGGTNNLVSVDALQEFRIETSSFAPEFGRSPGGQVLLTTRSGTNDFHGGVFDYFRNTAMDANDWFANAAGNPRAPEHHNDFGGFLGGRILRDRTFFFFSYEGSRLDLPQTTVINVPSEYARSIASPGLAPYLDAYPQPNDRTNVPGTYTAPFTGTYANTASLNATSIRVDHTFNARYSVFGRYNYAPSNTLQRQVSLSDLWLTNVNTQTVTGGLNVAVNSQMSDTFRGNYSVQSAGLSFRMDSFGGATPLAPSLLIGSLPPAQNVGLFYSFDSTYYLVGVNGKNQAQQANLTDDFSWVWKTHQMKFGGDYRAIFLDLDNFQHQASYYATSVNNFLATGAVNLLTQTQLPAKLGIHSLSLYAQDTWNVNSRLVVTYGVRWELSPAPSARGNTALASWRDTADPSAITLAPPGTPVWSTTYGNFAPRAGIAYRLNQKGDLVLRVGAGIFYDLGVGGSANLGYYFPNSANSTSVGVSVPVNDINSYFADISRNPPYPTGTQGYDENLRLPRSYQWNLAVEKGFGDKQALSVTYVGQAGRKLLRQEALYQPTAEFGGDFLLTRNDAFSNYQALQVQYRKRLGSRVQAIANYTLSHSLDNASNDVVAGLSSTIISAANDYGSSSFDVRHSFSGAFTFDIPAAAKSGIAETLTKNWSIESVIVARSGFPFNAQLLFASPDPGGRAYARPDRNLGVPVWIPDAKAGGGQSLNPLAFSIPTTVRQGTEGRNDIAGFGLTQVDLSVARTFSIREPWRLQFRVDAFNVLNHPNFTNPLALVEFGSFYLSSQSMLNQGLGGLTPLFQEGGPRSLQLSLKLTF
jgi:hypothetical protein